MGPLPVWYGCRVTQTRMGAWRLYMVQHGSVLLVPLPWTTPHACPSALAFHSTTHARQGSPVFLPLHPSPTPLATMALAHPMPRSAGIFIYKAGPTQPSHHTSHENRLTNDVSASLLFLLLGERIHHPRPPNLALLRVFSVSAYPPLKMTLHLKTLIFL